MNDAGSTNWNAIGLSSPWAGDDTNTAMGFSCCGGGELGVRSPTGSGGGGGGGKAVADVDYGVRSPEAVEIDFGVQDL
jgi:hypothetical protein